MSRKRFGQLLQKYLRGECTPEEQQFVEHWYGLLETETGESNQALDTDELEARLWGQIQRQIDTRAPLEQSRVIPRRTIRYRWIGIAASLLLTGYWFFSPHPLGTVWPAHSLAAHSSTNSGWVEQLNTSKQPLRIRLEDGSAVLLTPQSSLRFPDRFAREKRIVYLTGDAFFDIQKLPSRPFYVYAGNVVTKVLGTSFFVRTQAATQQVRVEVVTGRVAVYEQPRGKPSMTNGVVLSPNQTATFFGEEEHFVTGLVERPTIIQNPDSEEKQPSFQFDDAPLSTVLTQLEQAYGIDIEVENEQQSACPLTADLTNQPLYTQLDIICAALKATYNVQGTTILISGNGCSN